MAESDVPGVPSVPGNPKAVLDSYVARLDDTELWIRVGFDLENRDAMWLLDYARYATATARAMLEGCATMIALTDRLESQIRELKATASAASPESGASHG